jgi:hypothetical protein
VSIADVRVAAVVVVDLFLLMVSHIKGRTKAEGSIMNQQMHN